VALALEQLLVGAIVFGCAVFSLWRLLPVRLRLKALDGLSRLPASAGGGWAQRLRHKTLGKLSAGCDSCGGAAAGRKVSANVQPLNRRPAAPRR
jgi:hypothetical protein